MVIHGENVGNDFVSVNGNGTLIENGNWTEKKEIYSQRRNQTIIDICERILED